MSASNRLMKAAGMPATDFRTPAGEAALTMPNSVSWQVFKNPISLFIGGVTAVIMELAEPRVRTGVWDHTTFRTDPLSRMKRTGLAAMITVYGPRSLAEPTIAHVRQMHDAVRGTTPCGQAYFANDPELLNWVSATAGFGFLNAYHQYVRPLSPAARDAFYAEGREASALYGATGAPTSEQEMDALITEMLPKLEPSDILDEFITIMHRTKVFPAPARPLQHLMIRAAVELTPASVLEAAELKIDRPMRGWERRVIKSLGSLADRIAIKGSPQVDACRRMGLSGNYLVRNAKAVAAL